MARAGIVRTNLGVPPVHLLRFVPAIDGNGASSGLIDPAALDWPPGWLGTVGNPPVSRSKGVA
jgi:hypothetical protein